MHHKDLLEKVRQLEAEKHIVEEYLRSCVRVPWCPYHQPTSPHCCKNPTIPEEPTQPSICGSSGASSDVTNGNMMVTNDNMMVANDNINNNNMPLCMSGVDMSTNGSSVS